MVLLCWCCIGNSRAPLGPKGGNRALLVAQAAAKIRKQAKEQVVDDDAVVQWLLLLSRTRYVTLIKLLLLLLLSLSLLLLLRKHDLRTTTATMASVLSAREVKISYPPRSSDRHERADPYKAAQPLAKSSRAVWNRSPLLARRSSDT